MKPHSALFLRFILLGLFGGYLSSNPESVMVQSPEDNEEKTGKIQMKESLPKISAVSEIPRNVVVKIMRPVMIGSELFWQEVGSESSSRIRTSSQYRNSWRYFRPSLQNSRKTTEKNIDVNTETSVSKDRFKMSQNGNSGTNVEDDRSQILRSSYKGNNPIIIDDRSQVLPNEPKGNRGIKGGYDPSQVAKTNLEENRGKNGEEDKSQMPQSNLKGETNDRDDKSSTSGGEVLGDTFHVFPENEETFFEDDHQTKPAVSSPARISADSSFFAGIVNDFAFKLEESLNLESNFVISPLSIYIALSMCYLGSDGRTKAQIEQALGMNENAVHDENLHQGIKDLISLIMERTSGYELFSANGMFLGKNFTTEVSFVENIKNYYDAEIKNLDFTNPDLSLEFINKWVSDNTRNMISNIINSPPPMQTRLLLLNAIFFKGVWKTQFPIHLTSKGIFHLLDGSDKEVQYMKLFDEKFPIVKSDENKHTFIKLPYEGDQVSMIIALPHEREKPMPSTRDQILCYIRDGMVNSKVDIVEIPKFRLDYRISLIRPLQNIGIVDIFNRNVINFRKMRKENDIYVNGFMHKSVVEIDEVGTTASASTSVGIIPLSYENRTRFIANHPFAFYIIHEPTGLVLFYGKVFDFGSAPTASNSRNREDMRIRPRPNPNRRG